MNCCVRLLTNIGRVCVLAVDVAVDRTPGVELIVEPVPLTTELPTTETEGLLFDESLAVCAVTEFDAPVDGLTTDGVGAAGDETEFAAAGEIGGATLVETPVPTGTF
ncbi:MAG: hypothetical protein LQ352_002251 [Teloschistes flavicans]|nr:MAG: hypothetical protein LQ352_002251 [Teloschistes flavicans]